MYYFRCILFNLRYRLCITWIIHQKFWGYKIEEKLCLEIREQRSLNTVGLEQDQGCEACCYQAMFIRKLVRTLGRRFSNVTMNDGLEMILKGDILV
jgi:hypothetical protein